MILVWQRHRSDFNHDWLKNQYMNRLDGCIERLKIEGADISRIVRFITQDFPEWEQKRETACELVASFEREMSPRVLFEQGPLNRCDAETKEWLGELVHALWMARYPVKKWICEAEKALKSADCQYAALKKVLDSLNRIDSEQLASLLPSFVAFKQACKELSQAISQFPHEVLVV
ncbi:MAG: hypothetical protein ACE5PV_18910 [Candidatus Poribacteria bacterium]